MTGASAALLQEAYDGATAVVAPLDAADLDRPTRCEGFTVADLLHHMLLDAQRALVALHSPAAGPADVDAVSYWAPFRPGHPGSDEGAQWVRTATAAFARRQRLVALWSETAAAVCHAAGTSDPAALVTTQGHVIRVADLLSTLVVEAVLHHLDLTVDLPAAPPPGDVPLQHTRVVLDGLLGDCAPPEWPTVDYALAAGGRVCLTPAERSLLGPAAQRFPLIG